ncbi:MAG: PIN domain-containing protein [archaeon]|nr:PIN domain-containing protein [archaeon]MCR4323475.1 PIN domain-containing protein [Nanoarchaeota archaeon]
MNILLDTNFILTCARQKIDFVNLAEQMISEKIEWIVPQDVLNELKKIRDKRETNLKDRMAAEVSLEILEKLKPKVIELKGNNPNIDQKIIDYISGRDMVLATLDKSLKSKIDNKVLTVRGKKSLEIV